MQILDGKKVSAVKKAELKEKCELLRGRGIWPCLAVILIGEDPASASYVRAKAAACEKIGIKSLPHTLPEATTQNELLALINALNYDDSVDGILVQLPLPSHINKNLIIEAISPAKDVDGFHPLNVGALSLGGGGFLPCTPLGIMRLLAAYGLGVSGLNAVVIGASHIVGRPVASLLLRAGATVTVCHLKTRNLAQHTAQADLIIIATGQAGLLKASMIKPGAIIIDVGISRVEGQLVGDVDPAGMEGRAGWLSPVPGGVGPMTIAMLLENTLRAAKNRLRATKGLDDELAQGLKFNEIIKVEEDGGETVGVVGEDRGGGGETVASGAGQGGGGVAGIAGVDGVVAAGVGRAGIAGVDGRAGQGGDDAVAAGVTGEDRGGGWGETVASGARVGR